MLKFTYTEPELRTPTGKDRRWYVYYTLSYEGKKAEYRKEYGAKNYDIFLEIFNSESEREDKATELLERISSDLRKGRDPKYIWENRIAKLQKAKEEALKIEENRISIDDAIAITSTEKGWTGDIAYTKENSAKNILSFYRNGLKNYFIKIGKDQDVTQITKTDIKNFIELHFNAAKGYREWSSSSCSINRGYISILFNVLVEKELMLVNPARGIKIKQDSEKINASNVEIKDPTNCGLLRKCAFSGNIQTVPNIITFTQSVNVYFTPLSDL